MKGLRSHVSESGLGLSAVESQCSLCYAALFSLLAAKQGKSALLGLLLLYLFILPAALFGEDAKKEAGERVKPQTDFVLTIQDNRLSLNAQQASLQAILDEIGRAPRNGRSPRTSISSSGWPGSC